MSIKDIFNSNNNNILKESLLNLTSNSESHNSSKIFSKSFEYNIEINFTKYKLNQNENNIETNRISTSKYTKLNAIPKILLEQFSKMANVYFLIIALLQMIKEISNADGKPVILLPLSVVVLINGIKDFYEDWKRKKSDDEENSKLTYIYNPLNKCFDKKQWKDIKLGDIIKIYDNEFFPCDCLIISTSENNGICYIETKSIDGETNLKFKKGNVKIITEFNKEGNNNNKLTDEDRLKRFDGCIIQCEKPNEFIYEFNGKFIFNLLNENPTFLDYENFLLRGCSLKQTKFIYAFVIYIGHESKIMKNSPVLKDKVSKVEKIMNHQILVVFIIQVFISLISSIIGIIQLRNINLSYLFGEKEKYNEQSFSFSNLITRCGTWIVLLNNIVPISLLVTLEMIKYIQGMFISWDIYMYDKETKTCPIIQTSTLNEELGQVKFIFSDKTGTLTKNYMEFKGMSIGGKIYGLDDEDKYLEINNDSLNENYYNNNNDNLIENNYNNNKEKKLELKDNYGVVTNFNFKSLEFKRDFKSKESSNFSTINLFFLTLSICHSVITDQNSLPKIIYKSSSPDETAMVNCARYFGYIFSGRDIFNNLYLKDKNGNETQYKILNILEYTSERKKMSVIVECPDKKIRLFSKGADSVISELITENESLIEKTNNHLIKFAKKGLRTLMIAYREISNEEYLIFEREYQNALNNPSQRNTLLKKAYSFIERNYILLGATAIEDKLQDNVSEVLFSFIGAGIKIWVLTGDNMDTAKSIAYSCKLITHDFIILEFPEKSKLENITLKLKEFSKIFYDNTIIKNNTKYEMDNIEIPNRKKYALIISQNELNKITSDKHLLDLFYSISIRCNSVLCCRVTPKQKSEMVKLIRNRQPNTTTLSIGDGANDVNMITSANIGIGIIGVEGRQAMRASDYAISQFKYLKRLLFVHGRESYRKNSFVVCYNFYKNFLFVLPHFWFGFLNYFSGNYLYDPWIYQFFNIIFTSFPIIWFGIYDKEVSYDLLMIDNRYYTQGIIGKLFHPFRFWKWVFYGILQAIFVFIYSFYGDITPMKNGFLQDLPSSGSIAYSNIVLIVNFKILQTTCTHSFISAFLFLGSVLSYYFILFIMSLYWKFFNFNNFYMMAYSINFYFSTFCFLMICFTIDVGLGKLFRIYGLIRDPLEINLDDFDKDVKERTIELIRMEFQEINEKNNLYTGSAFNQSENKEVFNV